MDNVVILLLTFEIMLLLEKLVSSTRPDSSLIISQTLFHNDSTVTIRLRYFLCVSFFLCETCSDMKGELVEKKTTFIIEHPVPYTVEKNFNQVCQARHF